MNRKNGNIQIITIDFKSRKLCPALGTPKMEIIWTDNYKTKIRNIQKKQPNLRLNVRLIKPFRAFRGGEFM